MVPTYLLELGPDALDRGPDSGLWTLDYISELTLQNHNQNKQ